MTATRIQTDFNNFMYTHTLASENAYTHAQAGTHAYAYIFTCTLLHPHKDTRDQYIDRKGYQGFKNNFYNYSFLNNHITLPSFWYIILIRI